MGGAVGMQRPVPDPIRVMVVDDAVVIRGLIRKWVEEEPGLSVVAVHKNGRDAVDDLEAANPDIVVLDVEMPQMDGIVALPLMLEKRPDLTVIMASTPTLRNAAISLKALELGAKDYIPKPESNSGVTTSVDFRRELIDKLTHLGRRKPPMRAASAFSFRSAGVSPGDYERSRTMSRQSLISRGSVQHEHDEHHDGVDAGHFGDHGFKGARHHAAPGRAAPASTPVPGRPFRDRSQLQPGQGMSAPAVARSPMPTAPSHQGGGEAVHSRSGMRPARRQGGAVPHHPVAPHQEHHHQHGAPALRPFNPGIPGILAIGSSTGGPQALQLVLKAIGPLLRAVPLVITQHMPPNFTAILAEHLGKASGCPSKEGEHDEVLQPGHIYVAPGARHMALAKSGTSTVIRLSDAPPVNFCKPAVDPLFDSVARLYGKTALGIILTGMGHDGAEGGRKIAMAGGNLLTQDEATSVVWGMPGAAVATGMCSAVLPIHEIGPAIGRILKGGRL